MNKSKLPIAIFNGTVATTNGLYRITDIDVEHAKELVKKYGIVSAVGHEATAVIMTELLGVEVPLNRIQFFQEITQLAIVFKLHVRPPEGTVLSMEECERIGFGLKLMERLE